MLVEIPHALNENVEDLEFSNRDIDIIDYWDSNTLRDISHIFLIKHGTRPELSCLMYIYNNGVSTIRYINADDGLTMKNMVVKTSGALYDISNPWGSNYSRILIPSSEFFLRNPIDKINDSIISMGLSCEDCEIFMCNWTRKTLVTFNTGDKLFKKTYYKIQMNHLLHKIL